VIVADGRSTDNTQQMVQSLQAQYPHLHLINNPGEIVATGLNLALTQARGEIIVRVDGHCEIAPDYIHLCVKYLQQHQVDGVGGPLETVGETPLAQTIALAMSSMFGVGGSAFRTIKHKTMLVDTVAFPAYRRSILDQAGPFDEELVRNQDDEYNYRLRKMGARILLAADVCARYYSRFTLRSLWRQYFQYGYWKVRVMQKHPRQMQPRQFAPMALVGLLSLSSLLMPVSALACWLFICLAGAYMAANLAASIWTASQTGRQHLLRLTFVFSILHLSYGLGFWLGLIKFWRRWGDDTTQLQSLENRSILATSPE
jgi:GT2 family glycosyltransferase